MYILQVVVVVVSLAVSRSNALPTKPSLTLKDKLALNLPLKRLVDQKSGLSHKVAFPPATTATTPEDAITDLEEDETSLPATKTTATKVPSAVIATLPTADTTTTTTNNDNDDGTPSPSTTTTSLSQTKPIRPTYVDAAVFRSPVVVVNRPSTIPTTSTTTTTDHDHDYDGYFRVWDDVSAFGGELSGGLAGYPEGGFRPLGF